MTPNEVDRLTQVVFGMFGRKIGLGQDKIRKCVVAIVELNDPEINAKLKTLL